MTVRPIRIHASVLPGIAVAAMLLLLAAALLAELAVRATGLTLAFDRELARIVAFTTMQAALSTVLSLVVGIALAWSLAHQQRFPGRGLLIAMFSAALVLPTLIVVLGLVSVLGRSGWAGDLYNAVTGRSPGFSIYGLSGILIAHTYLNASFVVRTLVNRLEAVPPENRKLAHGLGLSAWRRFRLVDWPACAPSVRGLAVTIFLLCFTSFAIVLVLGGSPRYNTLEVAIYEAVRFEFDLGRALALALVQLAVCAALVAFVGGLRATGRSIHGAATMFAHLQGPAVNRLQRTIIIAAAIAFALPLIATLIDGSRAEFSRLLAEPVFARAALTSVLIAIVSAAIVVTGSVAMALTRRQFTLANRWADARGSPLAALAMSYSASLYLVFPALVLGLGFFLLARRLGGPADLWAVAALITANVTLALPFAVAVLVPTAERAAARYDRLAVSLGLAWSTRWRAIEWPLMRADIGYVAALALCLSLGDLGVIALFGTQDFTTLPWLMYQKIGAYRTADAAGVALILLSLVLATFIFVPRLFSGARHAAP